MPFKCFLENGMQVKGLFYQDEEGNLNLWKFDAEVIEKATSIKAALKLECQDES